MPDRHAFAGPMGYRREEVATQEIRIRDANSRFGTARTVTFSALGRPKL